MNVQLGKRILLAVVGGTALAMALAVGRMGPAVGQLSPPGPPFPPPPIFVFPPTTQIDHCSDFFDNDLALIFCLGGGPGIGGDGGNGGPGGSGFSSGGVGIGGAGGHGGDGGDGNGGNGGIMFFGSGFGGF